MINDFPDPKPVQFDAETQALITAQARADYEDGIEKREKWNGDHAHYDQMLRGNLPARDHIPWEGAADLHVQAPYWLVSAANVRLTAAIWNQVPLVGYDAMEDDDKELARDAAQDVEWHLSTKQMNARGAWARASKIRLAHGVGIAQIHNAVDKYFRPINAPKDLKFDEEDAMPLLEEDGETATAPKVSRVEETFYAGPVLQPLDWDDVVVPMDAMNVQPVRDSNPNGADTVVVRQYMRLSRMWKMKDAAFHNMEKYEGGTLEAWESGHPAQDRSGTGRNNNNTATRQHDHSEGRNRHTGSADGGRGRKNPEFEILTYYCPWEDPETGTEEEFVFFICNQPGFYLGGYRLSDMFFRGHRPLIDLHYETIGTRFYSMGICEIVKYLSSELDAIHNMRLDVGYATNLPFFFYKASSEFDPDEIELRPFKGIAVDNPRDIVFPQTQNVTSFFFQEEQQLYTLIERVVGITDLFLGISPTQGAAARHATGFIGTQQEALARTSEIMAQDAEKFAFLCHFVWDLELQYGPEERRFRLAGQSTATTVKLDYRSVWEKGAFDFSLGANQGMYSQQIQQQKGQILAQEAATNPLMQQDPGRLWQASHDRLIAFGFSEAEILSYIGPKEAISMGSPKPQDEEIGEMMQAVHGVGVPAPIHPSDDDRKHIQEVYAFLNEMEGYSVWVERALMAHAQLHTQAIPQKQQQIALQQMAQNGGQPAQPAAAAPTDQNPMGQQDRMMAQMIDQGQGTTPQMGNGQNGSVSPSLPPNLATP